MRMTANVNVDMTKLDLSARYSDSQDTLRSEPRVCCIRSPNKSQGGGIGESFIIVSHVWHFRCEIQLYRVLVEGATRPIFDVATRLFEQLRRHSDGGCGPVQALFLIHAACRLHGIRCTVCRHIEVTTDQRR